MIRKLHKHQKTDISIEPRAGQRGCLCSNSIGIRCPALDFKPNPELVTDEMLIDYLAGILVEGFIELKKHERGNKKSDSILSGFDKRAS